MHHRLARSAENIAAVNESVAEDMNMSIPRRSQELGLSYGTLWRNLHLDLHHMKFSSTTTEANNVVDSWNGCLNNRRRTAIFRTKRCDRTLVLRNDCHRSAMVI